MTPISILDAIRDLDPDNEPHELNYCVCLCHVWEEENRPCGCVGNAWNCSNGKPSGIFRHGDQFYFHYRVEMNYWTPTFWPYGESK
jgi:hypothetical protein